MLDFGAKIDGFGMKEWNASQKKTPGFVPDALTCKHHFWICAQRFHDVLSTQIGC